MKTQAEETWIEWDNTLRKMENRKERLFFSEEKKRDSRKKNRNSEDWQRQPYVWFWVLKKKSKKGIK